MTKADIIVVGGGVIGASIALRLLADGKRVCLIDAGTDIPPATRAAAGMLAPSFEEDMVGGPLEEFGRASLKAWPRFAAMLEAGEGSSVDLKLNGILGVYKNHQGALNGDELKALEPGLGNMIKSANFVENEGQVDPLKLAHALMQNLKQHASFVFVQACVSSIEATLADVCVGLTNGETLSASTLVLATGATKTIKANFPIQPIGTVKGEALAVRQNKDQPILHHVVRAEGVYLCPKSDGRIVIGATEIDGAKDLSVDGSSIAELRRRAQIVVPELEMLPEVARWAGLRPSTSDTLPILGRSDRVPETIIFAMGHYRHGILLAPKTAEFINNAIQSHAPSGNGPFSPDRFNNLEVVHHDLAKFQSKV